MLAATDMTFLYPITFEKLHLKAEPEASFLQVLSIFEDDLPVVGSFDG